MRDSGYKIIEIDELKKKYAGGCYQVIVFGTWEYGRRIKKGLEGFGIPVSYYADNDVLVQQKILDEINVIAPEQIQSIENPLVIIGSFWFSMITNQLRKLGVETVYALLECPVNSYDEVMADRDELAEYFHHYSEKKSDNVLVEVYGHIGDIFVKTGICKQLIDEYGKENVYFWVDNTEGRNIGLFLSLLSPNVIQTDRNMFTQNREYRLEKLKFLNSKYFQFSYSLGDMRFHLKMRYLNKFILNIENVYYAPEEYYAIEKDYKLLGGILGRDIRYWCEEHNNIVAEIKNVTLKISLPEQFVAIGMGAANALRRYPFEKFKTVLEALVRKGYTAVLLGAGSEDENFYNKLIQEGNYGNAIINLTSKLNLLETLAVISKCTFFLGVDSGLWHGSFILQKKSVVIYGKGDWGHFKHDRDWIYYVTSKQDRCVHCHYWDCPKADRIKGSAPCVETVEPEAIMDEIRKLESTLSTKIVF